MRLFALQMRLIVFTLFLFTLSLAACGQGKPRPAFPPGEEICGFLGNYAFVRPAQVQRGLAVDLFVGDAGAEQPTTLRFFVHERPRNQPVDDLQVEHEKLIHVLGVRDDLTGFFHVHPSRVARGQWAVSHVFTNAGNYRIWTNVKRHGISYAFEHPTLEVSGAAEGQTLSPNFSREVESGGCRVALIFSEPLRAGRTNLLQFEIRNVLGGQIRTENFLGTPMHLVIIKDDLSVFLHAHSDQHGLAGPDVTFRQTFPAPGRYKLFAQFRPHKCRLPPDASLLAELWVEVLGAVDEG